MNIHKLLFLLTAAIPSLTFAQGVLENPVAGSTESGIGVISGWHCTASIITVTIDGASLGKAGNGTSRNDTVSVCGRSDTGYSLLFNYNDLTPGSHNISAYADGQLLETRQFNTVQSGGSAFLTGISKTATISDFPSSGRTATLQWSQAKQSFVITGITDVSGSGAVDLSSLQGTYNQSISSSISGSSCAIYDISPGNSNVTLTLTTSGNTATVTSDSCTYNLSYSSGNSTSGFNFSGFVSCNSGLSGSVTVVSLRKASDRLSGTVTGFLPGCTQTISL
jgi:hypothetical protein